MAHEERSAGFIVFSTPGSSPSPPSELLDPSRITYLLLDYGRHWDFPKGHVEAGEDDLTAAVRELREETGLAEPHVIPDFRYDITYYFRHRKQGLVRKTVVFYLAGVQSTRIVLSHEHVGYVWLPFDLAVRRVTFANAKEGLRQAHARLVPARLAPATSIVPARPTDCRTELPTLFDPTPPPSSHPD